MGEMQFYRKEKKYTEDNIQDYLRDWITTGNVGKFYGTALWKAKRDEIMRRDGCMCQLCRMQGVQTPAEVVHHIEHLDRVENIPYALSNDNLLSLCKFCHKLVHKGYSVLGYWHNPPAWAQDLQQVILYYMRQQQQQSYFNPSYYFPDSPLSRPIQSQQQTANQQQQQQINNIYQQQGQQGQYYPYYYPYPYQPQGQQGQGQQQQQQPYIYPYQSQQPPQYNPYQHIPGA